MKIIIINSKCVCANLIFVAFHFDVLRSILRVHFLSFSISFLHFPPLKQFHLMSNEKRAFLKRCFNFSPSPKLIFHFDLNMTRFSYSYVSFDTSQFTYIENLKMCFEKWEKKKHTSFYFIFVETEEQAWFFPHILFTWIFPKQQTNMKNIQIAQDCLFSERFLLTNCLFVGEKDRVKKLERDWEFAVHFFGLPLTPSVAMHLD